MKENKQFEMKNRYFKKVKRSKTIDIQKNEEKKL